MTEPVPHIPNRALFKAAEVCEIAKLQPYVLRSWEAEFNDLGVVRGGSSTRVYRRGDVERVLRIKQLVFGEGLTLAGVRRRLSDESGSLAENVPFDELFGRHARERLTTIKQGLQSLLELLSWNGRQTSQPLQQRLPVVSARAAKPGRRSPLPSAGSKNGRGKRRARA